MFYLSSNIRNEMFILLGSTLHPSLLMDQGASHAGDPPRYSYNQKIERPERSGGPVMLGTGLSGAAAASTVAPAVATMRLAVRKNPAALVGSGAPRRKRDLIKGNW